MASIADHTNAPAIPMIPASVNELKMLPTICITFSSCDLYASPKANTNTIHRTSESADSSTRIVLLLSCICSNCTSGITTAEEVPPRIAPSVNAVKGGIFTSNHAINPTTIVVTKKLPSVNAIVPFIAARIALIRRSNPPWKRINANVTVVKTSVSTPNASAFTKPSMGPMTRPIIMSSSTSGIRFFSNRPVKRCETKTNNPINITNSVDFILPISPSLTFHHLFIRCTLTIKT